MIIEIPGNNMVEDFNLPNGEYVKIVYIQTNEELAMPERKYSAPYREIMLYKEENGEFIGSSIEINPHYTPQLATLIFEHLDEIEYK